MQKDNLKFNWNKWRNRWVWFNGKKMKLRHYIAVNSKLMVQCNKKGWAGVDHYLNYKICLSRYGLAGLKHYENRFYKGVPMPYNQTMFQKIGLWFQNKIIVLKNYIKTFKA
ncbi:hypothetical protein ACFQ5N_02340 [Lutibacter holmesii]|uniref:Group II intron maturase-specific domain-containing protein n=1 Tax=Lutibacter holmesii TaxID=1137985 RepID=A0ABW3WJQ2_9FLAO